MIIYDHLWETMRRKGVTQYALIHKHHVSPGQITRLKRNESVSTHTIDMLCGLLECSVEDVMTHVKDEEGRFLDQEGAREPTVKAAEDGIKYPEQTESDIE